MVCNRRCGTSFRVDVHSLSRYFTAMVDGRRYGGLAVCFFLYRGVFFMSACMHYHPCDHVRVHTPLLFVYVRVSACLCVGVVVVCMCVCVGGGGNTHYLYMDDFVVPYFSV